MNLIKELRTLALTLTAIASTILPHSAKAQQPPDPNYLPDLSVMEQSFRACIAEFDRKTAHAFSGLTEEQQAATVQARGEKYPFSTDLFVGSEKHGFCARSLGIRTDGSDKPQRLEDDGCFFNFSEKEWDNRSLIHNFSYSKGPAGAATLIVDYNIERANFETMYVLENAGELFYREIRSDGAEWKKNEGEDYYFRTAPMHPESRFDRMEFVPENIRDKVVPSLENLRGACHTPG